MKKLLLLCVFFILCSINAHAIDMNSFGRIPIQHEGRIKPLDSFARVTLMQLTGRDEFMNRPAIDWLALSLFEPDEALHLPLFTVRNAALRQKIDLPETEQEAYSAAAMMEAISRNKKLIAPLLEADNANLTEEQQELRGLYEKTSRYLELLGSLTMILPLDAESGDTYLYLSKSAEALSEKIKNLAQRKGQNLENYSPAELLLLQKGMRMQFLDQSAVISESLRVIPGQWDKKDEWLTPWTAIRSGHGSPLGMAYLKQWQDLAQSYHHHDQKTWNDTVNSIKTAFFYTSGGNDHSFRLILEQFYNHTKPFATAEVFYMLALLLLVLPFRQRTLKPACIAACLSGLILHFLGIGARIIILERPPVGTLYESVLFVSFITGLVGLTTYKKTKEIIYLASGIVIALLLLFIAPTFSSNGDSMEVLVAVLNTNFWLATHVVCITAAYGVCILASALAHIELFMRARKKTKRLPQKNLLHRTLLGALFLTAFGTVLGGIWADQSWGRFWGWDPKENGALLIVLWLVWLLHGRMSGHIKETAFTALSAALSIIVALSWFGVNLLSVGLHSYGFVSGIASGLFLFCFAEISFIAFCTWRINKHAK